MRTTLVLNGSERVGLEQLAASASFEWRFGERWTASFAAGGLFGGRLVPADGAVATGAGGVVSAGVSWLFVEQLGARPFLQASGSVAVSALSGASPYQAGDARLGLVAGYTLFERLTPYATARVFGGPVFWRGGLGTDAFHFQLGAGLVLGLPAGFDVAVEVVPLGEQRAVASVGASF